MTSPTFPRILAIALSSRGLGFAVLEGPDTLLNWGGKELAGKHKNANGIIKVEELIKRHAPEVLVLEDTKSKNSRRSPRIRELTQELVALAGKRTVKVRLIPRIQVMRVFFPDGVGTKHAVAEIVADKFPEELAFRLPPKRRAWKSEDARMDVFDAVALCLAFRRRRGR